MLRFISDWLASDRALDASLTRYTGTRA